VIAQRAAGPFFSYANPWPETTHWPFRCSAPGDGMPPCGRADFVPEIPCADTDTRYMLHMGLSTGCRLPAPCGAGRSGCRCALFRVHYGLVLYDRNQLRQRAALPTAHPYAAPAVLQYAVIRARVLQRQQSDLRRATPHILQQVWFLLLPTASLCTAFPTSSCTAFPMSSLPFLRPLRGLHTLPCPPARQIRNAEA
jgi:hypothetical protein